MDFLVEAAESMTGNRQLESARVFSHESAPGGFSLVLTWDTESIPVWGSDTSMVILDSLKALGLADHTILVARGRSGK
jgi:hypothetical protein